MRWALLTAAVMLGLAAPAPARAAVEPEPPSRVAATVPPELVPVLERAARYVLEYEQSFQGVGAVEAYTQSTQGLVEVGGISRSVEGAVPAEPLGIECLGSSWCRRATKADVVFARFSGGGWTSYRDVYEVDGRTVRDRDRRLERLFSDLPAAEAEHRGQALLEDGDTRYGIGPCMRNLNAPTLGLTILHPSNQARFRWKQAGKRRVDGVATVEVAFEEIGEPTLLRQSDGEPLRARGRLWIDPAHGTLVRSEMEFRFAPRWAQALVAVQYRLSPKLGIWVPAQRREEYDDLRGGPPMFGRPTKATAEYSGFHRLDRAAGAGVAAATPVPMANPAAAGGEPASPYGPELVEALQRAGAYVAEYERSFSNLLVEEVYKQTVSPRVALAPEGGTLMVGGGRQTTKAELVFVRLAGPFAWASYRDVFEVDGQKLREQDGRLMKLLSNPRPDAQEQADRLLAASAAYNIGPVTRTVNLPTLPLVFLLADNRARFEFGLGERRTIAATETVEVTFRETARPTLVRGPRGADLPAAGRFWVNPTHGTVVRSEVEFDFGPEAEARVSTDYRPEPTLAMWVPSEMREAYADAKGAKLRTFANPFKGEARYGKFRRFTVSTDEALTEPAAPQ